MTARGPPGSGAFLGEWPVVVDKIGGWSLGLLSGYHLLEEMSGVQSRCEIWCADLVFRMWCTGLSGQSWCAELGWFIGLGWCSRLVCRPGVPGLCAELGVQG